MIKLEAYNGDYSINFTVEFYGPLAESLAFIYMTYAESRRFWVGEHFVMEDVPRFDEWSGEYIGMGQGQRMALIQPYLINPNTYPNLYEYFNPKCHHGLDADLCMDPYGENHFGTMIQEMAGML